MFRSISSAKQKSILNRGSTIVNNMDVDLISDRSRNAFEIEIGSAGTDDGNRVQDTTTVEVTEVQNEHIGVIRPRTDDDDDELEEEG
jgi:hypothetical protein